MSAMENYQLLCIDGVYVDILQRYSCGHLSSQLAPRNHVYKAGPSASLGLPWRVDTRVETFEYKDLSC